MPRTLKKKTTEKRPESAKAVIYVRVSSKEQEEGFSLDAQLEVTRKHAADKGFEVVAEFREVETAKEAGRTQFQKMIKMMKAGKASHIIVEKVDRLIRNLPDYGTLDGCGATIHFAKEGGNPLSQESTSQDKFMYGIRVLMAKNYIDNLKEEITKGMSQKAKQGYYPSFAPIGYENVAKDGIKIIVPDPVRAPLIRMMFEAYADGSVSLGKLATYAKMIGLYSRKGKPLATTTIQTILLNPTYAGIVEWHGEQYPGKHEALISLALFEAAQRTMRGRSVASAGKGKQSHTYAGLITCAACGCAISPYYSKKGGCVYYACSGARGCKRTGVREEAIDAFIARHFDALMIPTARFEQLRMAIKDVSGEQSKAHASEVAAVVAERDRVSERLEKLYLDRLDGQVSDDVYRKFRSQWEGQLADANEKLGQIDRANLATWDDSLKMLEMVSNSANRFKTANSERRREIAKWMLSNFTMSAGNLALELRPSFKMVAEANAYDLQNPGQKGVSEIWYSALDSLRTIAA